MTRLEKDLADYLLKDCREELKQMYSKLAVRVFNRSVNYCKFLGPKIEMEMLTNRIIMNNIGGK